MRLTAVIRLLPDETQTHALLDTIRAVNSACNYASQVAFEQRAFGRKTLHTLVYREIRARFGLPAQLAVHVISKVVDAYRAKGERKAVRTFQEVGAVRDDGRVLRLKVEKRLASLSTLKGRLAIPFAAGEPQLRLLRHPVRELTSWLFTRRGKFFLAVVCAVDDPEAREPEGVLGVDLGQANLATDSTGERFSGELLTRARLRSARLRRRLQKRGTQSARRHLRKLARKERNFARTTNHTIAKRLVEKAQRDCSGESERHARQDNGFPGTEISPPCVALRAAAVLSPVQSRPCGRACGLCRPAEHLANVPGLRTYRQAQQEISVGICLPVVWLLRPRRPRGSDINIAARAAVNRPRATANYHLALSLVGWHGSLHGATASRRL